MILRLLKFKYLKNIILLPFILIFTACSSLPKAIEHNEQYSANGDNKIFVISHGWHTGITLPTDKIFIGLPELSNRFGKPAYIEFGWGDEKFYQAKETTTKHYIQAIFWPTDSVIHAVAIPKNVESYFQNSEVETLCLNDEELDSVIKFILGSFAKNKNSKIISLKSGLYGDSQFYQAVGDYHLLNTCNHWTAKGLKSFGMDIIPLFKITANSVMTYIQSSKESQSDQNINKCF